MAPESHAVRRTGRKTCDLCGRRGTEASPLSRHHVDGNSKNNDPVNWMVVHRILCHTAADYITQMFRAQGKDVTFEQIVKAWQMLMVNDWLYKLLRGEL